MANSKITFGIFSSVAEYFVTSCANSDLPVRPNRLERLIGARYKVHYALR